MAPEKPDVSRWTGLKAVKLGTAEADVNTALTALPPATWPQPFRPVLSGEATFMRTVCSGECQLSRFCWTQNRNCLELGLQVLFKLIGEA